MSDIPLEPQGNADNIDRQQHSHSSANSHDVKRSRVSKYDFDSIVRSVRGTCRGLSEFDAQDIALEVLYTFMRKEEEVVFMSSDAYLAAIIRSKIRDFLRRQKVLSRLPVVSISTIHDDHDLDIPYREGDRLIDPANEIDEKLTGDDCVNDLADKIALLPPCQQRAVICNFIDKHSNPEPLILALRARNISESQMRWPKDQNAKRVLQASLPAARQSLANVLHIDLTQYKRRSRRQDSPGTDAE